MSILWYLLNIRTRDSNNKNRYLLGNLNYLPKEICFFSLSLSLL